MFINDTVHRKYLNLMLKCIPLSCFLLISLRPSIAGDILLFSVSKKINWIEKVMFKLTFWHSYITFTLPMWILFLLHNIVCKSMPQCYKLLKSVWIFISARPITLCWFSYISCNFIVHILYTLLYIYKFFLSNNFS